MNKKNKSFFLVCIFVLNILATSIFGLNIFTKDVYADELTFGVTPSKINNIIIDHGKEATIRFKVGNKTVYNTNDTKKYDLYNFKIKISAFGENKDTQEIDASKWITFNRDEVQIKPKQVEKVYAKLSIPKDVPNGVYTAYVNFKRIPLDFEKKAKDNIYESNIKVPIFIFVGTKGDFDKLKANYIVTDSSLIINNYSINNKEDSTSIFREVLLNLKKLCTINPSKVVNTFKSISNRPYYKTIKKYDVVYDINENLTTTLDKVITSDKSKLNEWKYVFISNELKSKKVKNVKFNKNSITFNLLDTKENIVIENYSANIEKIKSQLIQMIKISKGELTVNSLLENLYVPINKNYLMENSLYVKNTIKNQGDKLITPKALCDLIYNGVDKIGTGESDFVTIAPHTTEDINTPLKLTSSLLKGNYVCNSVIHVDGKNLDKTFKFKVKNIRTYIFVITLILYILILLLIILIIILLIKKLKDKNKNKDKENQKNNINNNDIEKKSNNINNDDKKEN